MCLPEAQSFTSVVEQKCLSDLLVILDNSGSVEHDFSPEKDIAAKLVDDLNVTPPDTRVGLVEFNQAATSDFSFNKFNEKEGVVWAIRNLTQVGGSTNTADALKLALEEFQNYGRRDVNKILLLITDGNSQNTLELLRERTNELSRAGVVIFTATTSESPGLLEFQIYSQNQPDRVFLKSNLTSLLTKISKTIHEGTCIKPLEVSTTGYGPPPTEPQTVPPPINCKQFQADIVFLVDGSSSIGLKIFQDEALRFIKDFVSELDIGPDKTHVAFVQYSHYIRHEFDLKDFSTKEDTIKAISGVQYIEGRTLTGGAIKDTVENAFSKANGAREKAAKVILVITDGRAQDDVEQPAKAARNAGIRMIAVGVTDHILESELKEIAGDESRVKIAINYTALNDGNLRRLLEAITCNRE